MKFLCMTCDTQMKTVENRRQQEDGTLAIVLECPECFGQVGMLTNPMETRMLDALDVSVCPVGGKGRKAAEEPASVAATASEPVANAAPNATGAIEWTAEAEERMKKLPTFVRPMARKGIESFARERGPRRVTPQVLDEARAVFGM
jgi:hypothetical protein